MARLPSSVGGSALGDSAVGSPIKCSRGMLADATTIWKRYCGVRRTVAGFTPFTLIDSARWAEWASVAPANPYEQYAAYWTLYKNRADVWHYENSGYYPPVTGVDYTGSTALSGAGDTPAASYPDVNWPGIVTWPAYGLAAPQSVAWFFNGGLPPTINLGSYYYGGEVIAPTGVSATSRTFSQIREYDTETLSETLSGLQDTAGKYGTALGALNGLTFDLHAWPTTSYLVGFHDWGEVNTPNGFCRDTYLIETYDYTYSGEQFTINSASDSGVVVTADNLVDQVYQAGSGWNIGNAELDSGGPVQAIETRRTQIRIQTTKGVLPYKLLHIVGAGTGPIGGTFGGYGVANWPDASVNRRQWGKRVTLLKQGTLVMDASGYSVIELPYPTDKPFPVRNIQGIPVLYSLVALLIGTASIPLGDLIWVFTDGVGWEATYETAPVGPADSDASTDSTDASTDTQTL